MSSDDLTMADLTPEQQEIIKRWKAENQEKQKTVGASFDAFKNWVQQDLPNIWQNLQKTVDVLYKLYIIYDKVVRPILRLWGMPIP
ncbi:MAG: hypothetical protein ACRCU2_11965 [Planktothrix sp.]